MTLPDVDVIIPTFNSSKTLEQCLYSVRKQDYSGKIIITVIDGGSNDNSVSIAKSYKAEVVIKKGMYGTGKNGARHFGESITNAPFVMNIDSDNILVEKSVIRRLVDPMINDQTINISIPFTSIDEKSPSFNQWISLAEIKKVQHMASYGQMTFDDYILMPDVFYGITNCSLLRRNIISMCGGYDSDIRLLARIRRHGLSKGIIDKKSHFYHNQTDSLIHYLRKWQRRLNFFGKMKGDDLKNYFVEYPPEKTDDIDLKIGPIKSILYDPFVNLSYAIREKDIRYLWSLPYSVMFLSYIAIHPFLSYNVFRKFL